MAGSKKRPPRVWWMWRCGHNHPPLHKGVANRIHTAIPFRNTRALENPLGGGWLQNRSFVQPGSPPDAHRLLRPPALSPPRPATREHRFRGRGRAYTVRDLASRKEGRSAKGCTGSWRVVFGCGTMFYLCVAKYDLRAMEFSMSVLNQRKSNRTPSATSAKPAPVRSTESPWAISFLRLRRLLSTNFDRGS